MRIVVNNKHYNVIADDNEYLVIKALGIDTSVEVIGKPVQISFPLTDNPEEIRTKIIGINYN